jgi:WD40 repeat protein
LNWYLTIQKLNINNYIVFALDQPSYTFLKQHNINTFLVDKENKLFTEESHNFGSVGFIAICNEKPWVVNQVLKAGFHVVWTDTDIVWLKDPFPIFHYHRGVDMQIQSDDDDVCAGFFYAKSNAKTIDFFDHCLSVVDTVVDDQMAMRRFLQDPSMVQRLGSREECHQMKVRSSSKFDYWQKAGTSVEWPALPYNIEDIDNTKMNYIVLDRVLFPNGTAYFNVKLSQRAGIVPVIVHNNCIIGREPKKIRFELYNLWIIPSIKVVKSTGNEKKITSKFVLRAHVEVVTALESHKNLLLSAGYDKSLRIWDIESGKRLDSHFLNKRGGFWGMKFHQQEETKPLANENDKMLQIASIMAKSNTGSSNNMNMLQALLTAGSTSEPDPNPLDSTANDLPEILYTASHDKTIQVWNTKTWECKQTMKGHYGVINSVYFHRNIVFSASDDSTCRSWNPETGERIIVFRGHSDWVSCVTCAGPVVYTASKDKTLRAFEIATGRTLQVYNGHEDWARCCVVDSATSKHVLYSGSSDCTIRAWDVRDGNCLAIYKGHTGGVNALVFKNNVLYSASDDRTVRAWDVLTGECIAVYEGHNEFVTCLCITNEGVLCSGSADRTVIVWNMV